jgi:hypothetical protein
MAGCDKAGRNKKSKANEAYKGAKRWEINAKKKALRHKLKCTGKALKVPHGTARAERRARCQKMNGTLNAAVWKVWRGQELHMK